MAGHGASPSGKMWVSIVMYAPVLFLDVFRASRLQPVKQQ